MSDAARDVQDTPAPSVMTSPSGDIALIMGFTRHYLSKDDALRIGADLIERAGGLPEGPANPKSQIADLERVLELAMAAFDAESGPVWKIDTERAVSRHGRACDRLWEELRRQIEARRGAGRPVKPFAPKPDDAASALRRMKRAVIAELVERLPAAVGSILSEMEEEVERDDD